ncbi:MAG TPA: hypothetical protein VEB68_04635 [Croceibacterium sp.]|nr:hypothetical protein [Croceibacterium sp.]
MTDATPKQPPRDPKLDEDLRRNPGIGQSKGAFAMGGDLDYAEGENTVEGDVENDPSPVGGVTEKLGRTNR